ncbi:hypothetical protein FRC01_011107 [Tulasnella sp. 417]|nr:hypothetical protein FRC01_011107 [Tulasnella sp. 417]
MKTPFDSFSDISSIKFSLNQCDKFPLMEPVDGQTGQTFLWSHLSGSEFPADGEATPATWITEAFCNAKGAWWSGASSITDSLNHDNGTGFMEDYFAGASPPSTVLTETIDPRSATLALTSEWWDLFSAPMPHGASVFQSTPEGPASGDVCGSSSLGYEGLLCLLDLIPPSLGECDAQACDIELGQGSIILECYSPRSESDSGAIDQSPTPPDPALSPPATPSVSPALTSTQPEQPPSQAQIIDFKEEDLAPTPSDEPPQTFKFVFDLKTVDQEHRCRCKKKTKKKSRHWKSCPSNPNKPRISCPYCLKGKAKIFRGGSAMGNLQKHVRRYHPGEAVPRARRK